MAKALDIAEYIINKCTVESYPISNLQLQKIMYYVQSDSLRDSESGLIEENFEAWQFGPVIPVVYYKYCGFGAMKIRISCEKELNISRDNLNRMNKIIEEKRILNPWELVEDTHKQDKAWYEIYKDGAGEHQVIPKSLIRARG